nr:EOG090X07IA [Eurycercus lamellatus]
MGPLRVNLWLLRRKISASPYRSFLLASTTVLCMAYMGVFTHLAEKDYHTEFSYPLDIDLREARSLSVQPINTFNHTYLKPCVDKCSSGQVPRLLVVIKSALPHFDRRSAIRKTWGYEKRFSDVPIRTVFLLGTTTDPESQLLVDREDSEHGDIVQSDFHDHYGNNTLKTMSGLKWAVEFCSTASFVVFSDDDMYLSIKNLLIFLRNPSSYPDEAASEDQLSNEDPLMPSIPNANTDHRERSLKQEKPDDDSPLQGNWDEAQDLKLYAGYVFHSPPLRHRTSKWYVSLAEYPYHLWPPYVTAGAYVLSRSALLDLHYGSAYTQYFRFDDVFLGLVARKASIQPLHCPHFYFWKKPYSSSNPRSYRHVIASHGFHDPTELVHVWSRQKSAGYA